MDVDVENDAAEEEDEGGNDHGDEATCVRDCSIFMQEEGDLAAFWMQY